MTDRDLLAELLWEKAGHLVGLGGMSEWNDIHDRYRDDWRQIADAVLAAIGDRLLPELTDLPKWVQVRLVMSIPNGSTTGNVGRITTQKGTGPTIPAAIRNALEAGR